MWVKAAWAYILGEEEELRFHLDAGTVTILEGRCPKLSAEDERLLQRNQSHLFPAIPVHRAQSILTLSTVLSGGGAKGRGEDTTASPSLADAVPRYTTFKYA